MSQNHGIHKILRNAHAFHPSVEKTIDHKNNNNHNPINIDHILCVRKLENAIIARVTNGNSTFGNSLAIENIPGNIPTKRIIIAKKATTNNTIGYVVAPINLFLNEYRKAYSVANERNTVTRLPDDSHDLTIAISDALKY